MRHQRELALDRLADMAVVIAVTGGPPRCDPVDQLASIAEHDATTMGASDGQWRSHRLHLRIRQPDVVEAGLIPRRPRSSCSPFFRDIRRFQCKAYGHDGLRSMRGCIHSMNLRPPSSANSNAAVYAVRSSTPPG